MALVYPVVLQRAQPLPAPYRVTGFGQDVRLFFIDVGDHAAENLKSFRASLLEPASAPLTLVA